ERAETQQWSVRQLKSHVVSLRSASHVKEPQKAALGIEATALKSLRKCIRELKTKLDETRPLAPFSADVSSEVCDLLAELARAFDLTQSLSGKRQDDSSMTA